MRWIGGPLGEVRRLEERLIAGFGAQGLSFVSQIGAQILLVPLFIGAWGTALYQDWLLLFATAGFLGLADVGMQTYFGNLMVVARARGDMEQLNHVVAIAVGVDADHPSLSVWRSMPARPAASSRLMLSSTLAKVSNRHATRPLVSRRAKRRSCATGVSRAGQGTTRIRCHSSQRTDTTAYRKLSASTQAVLDATRHRPAAPRGQEGAACRRRRDRRGWRGRPLRPRGSAEGSGPAR